MFGKDYIKSLLSEKLQEAKDAYRDCIAQNVMKEGGDCSCYITPKKKKKSGSVMGAGFYGAGEDDAPENKQIKEATDYGFHGVSQSDVYNKSTKHPKVPALRDKLRGMHQHWHDLRHDVINAENGGTENAIHKARKAKDDHERAIDGIELTVAKHLHDENTGKH